MSQTCLWGVSRVSQGYHGGVPRLSQRWLRPNSGVPQRCLARTPGTSEVPGMHPRYLHKGAQLISGKATHGMPCKIGQNALWYMRVMVFWYKCEICDFTFWPDGDRTFRAHKQNSPRRCLSMSFPPISAIPISIFI